MAYNINLTNGDLLTIVEDGTADVSSTSIALIGRNFPGYGEFVNENFVHMLENFAGTTAPAGSIVGQLWYDTQASELKIYKTSGWTSANKPNIVNDTTSAGAHYLTFVSASSGTPDIKVSASKGIIFVPGSGNFGLGVVAAASKCVINANTNTSVAAPVTGTVVHVHGAEGLSARTQIDSYGGTTSGGNYSVDNAARLTLRRSNGTSAAPETVKNNDVVGSIGIRGYAGSSYSGTDQSSINVIATENWALGATGTKVTVTATPTGSGSAATVATFNGNGSLEITGAFRAGGDITAYFTSDERLKTNVQIIENALDKVISLDGITFNWNQHAVDKDPTVREAGVLAGQVESILPEVVTTRADGYKAVNYEKLVPLLIEAIKELKDEIDQLKKTA